ncbi:PREDICTED: uncharacterized protein LOC105456699 [Wasmannia auropunctata]|uniref:uncharacterized protein LOC105456699 n=1 Tax=Wasmannia auropunctata TaxID=64793 RepID=UPI0005EEB35A|nr:PREDICTED: uncharacterized protein LOC105456699 [Wasmannia auropunctata]
MKGTGTIFFILFVLTANLQNAESKKLSPQEMKEVLQPLTKHCIERVGTDPKMIDDAIKGNFASDWRLQCFFKCILVNTKMIKDDKIVEKAITNIIEIMLLEEHVAPYKKAVEHCIPAVKKLKGCALAYEFIKCCYDQAITVR